MGSKLDAYGVGFPSSILGSVEIPRFQIFRRWTRTLDAMEPALLIPRRIHGSISSLFPSTILSIICALIEERRNGVLIHRLSGTFHPAPSVGDGDVGMVAYCVRPREMSQIRRPSGLQGQIAIPDVYLDQS